ncbi:MAG: zinc ABC transporter substrate-binding protein [Armatimonadetes bacterium]|nr:zinc ABC transporter substrate-binding protein [Armatimonadota bacterium]
MKIIKFSIIIALIGFFVYPAFADIQVVTSIPDLAYITKQVGGDKVSVFSLAKGYQDPHQVDLKPSFMLKLSKANFFILMGLDLEVWARDLIEGSRNSEITLGMPGYVDCSEEINALDIPSKRILTNF